MKKVVIASSVLFAPFLASAQLSVGVAGGASALVLWLQNAFNLASGLIVGAAVVFFLWGVLQFVMSAGDDEAREKGKNHIIYGVIGIAVMVSIWGLVNFLTRSANLNPAVQSAPTLPTVVG